MINTNELLNYAKNLTVLLVEDNKYLQHTLSGLLQKFFHSVESVGDGKEALASYFKFYNTHHKYHDIIISNVHIPSLNGVELVSKIYELNKSQSFVIFSGCFEKEYLLPLLNLGVAKFIQKPLSEDDFLDAILDVTKKIQQTQAQIQNHFAKIDIDAAYTFERYCNILTKNNEVVHLTKYEIIFMRLLTTNPGRIYTNEEIVAKYISHNENLNMVNIRKIVSKLRKKLPDNCIESVYGIGYRIVPHLENKTD